jgi:hypothetical protein
MAGVGGAIDLLSVSLILVATLMVGGNIAVLLQFFPRNGSVPRVDRAILVTGLLGASTSTWVAVAESVLQPSWGAWLGVFLGMNTMMVAVGVWLVSLVFKTEDRSVNGRGWIWPVCLAGLLLVNEILMGTAFVGAEGGWSALMAPGGSIWVSVFTSSVNSVWFYWAMLANMLFLILWIPLPRFDRVGYLGLASTAGVAPWVVLNSTAGAIGMTVIMSGVLLLLFWGLANQEAPSPSTLRTLFGVGAGFLVMVIGMLLFLSIPRSPLGILAWASSSAAVMFGESLVLIRSALGRQGQPPSLNSLGFGQTTGGRLTLQD